MDERQAIRHLVATLSYRGTNILNDMPSHAALLRPHEDVRTPLEILEHVNGVLIHAHTVIGQHDFSQRDNASWEAAVVQFFDLLQSFDDSLAACERLHEGTQMQLLQGPLTDVMLHLGQIGIFRRIAGSPVAAETYFNADIKIGALRRPPKERNL